VKTWFPFGISRAVVGSVLPLHLVGFLLLGTVPVAGCGSDESTSAEAAAALPFEAEVTELYVSVLNRSPYALTDIRVTIIPTGLLRFTSTAAQLEGRGRRTFNIRDFRAHDGSTLDPRMSRPKSVLVVARDANGKEHQLQVPWKR
jgi:hypothetical protein